MFSTVLTLHEYKFCSGFVPVSEAALPVSAGTEWRLSDILYSI